MPGLGAREQAFVLGRTVIGGSAYGDRVLPGFYEIHCHNRDLAILPAFSRGDRRQKRGLGTSYADPSIQRSKDRAQRIDESAIALDIAGICISSAMALQVFYEWHIL